jgi:hypothetical protein
MSAPRAPEDSMRPRRSIGASGRPLNFTVRGPLWLGLALGHSFFLAQESSQRWWVARWIATSLECPTRFSLPAQSLSQSLFYGSTDAVETPLGSIRAVTVVA